MRQMTSSMKCTKCGYMADSAKCPECSGPCLPVEQCPARSTELPPIFPIGLMLGGMFTVTFAGKHGVGLWCIDVFNVVIEMDITSARAVYILIGSAMGVISILLLPIAAVTSRSARRRLECIFAAGLFICSLLVVSSFADATPFVLSLIPSLILFPTAFYLDR